ncbi:hypothetical protein MITS9509_00856 [Synechococcus sp. MIT S9509]|uniref:hypothetical protein n=1 Tax=unclassified Synechococcus TaxID=2626047 RepID=UPI0007BC7A3B|nr:MULTISPECIES: hypothetical protein [unclassified Synechococcus]KZR86912.1 hypothetical protein MITS9504_00998 [Synechococcus sp. MIT S9504]KZR92983.1 hypothetical protein MITS9509_00856 [Synechococcus sp. MIT S9509]
MPEQLQWSEAEARFMLQAFIHVRTAECGHSRRNAARYRRLAREQPLTGNS